MKRRSPFLFTMLGFGFAFFYVPILSMRQSGNVA